MKHGETLEPGLRWHLSGKKARRNSTKKDRKLSFRSMRRALKDTEFKDTQLLKKRVGFEY